MLIATILPPLTILDSWQVTWFCAWANRRTAIINVGARSLTLSPKKSSTTTLWYLKGIQVTVSYIHNSKCTLTYQIVTQSGKVHPQHGAIMSVNWNIHLRTMLLVKMHGIVARAWVRNCELATVCTTESIWYCAHSQCTSVVVSFSNAPTAMAQNASSYGLAGP